MKLTDFEGCETLVMYNALFKILIYATKSEVKSIMCPG